MSEETINLEIVSASRDALVLCLALGTLEAMRSGVWPLKAGIWTLGRPLFWEPLQRAGLPEEVLDIFQMADELDALGKLAGWPAAEVELDRMLGIIRRHLEALPDKSWQAGWPGYDVV
jgi:hypothetical protein